ncbi:cation-transporting P-type ATPase [Marinobacter changyiensis]|uniref:cation-transporting P-type ATPase n=1 Tax=Marinobacter changyiensis TaxID=2604091 RepID=UPI001265A2BB|nr:cation-transporting P-type ATPase [Marinobacter changyiensis]
METPARPAAERLDQYGYNRPPEAHRRGPLARLGNQLKNFLIYVLTFGWNAAIT